MLNIQDQTPKNRFTFSATERIAKELDTVQNKTALQASLQEAIKLEDIANEITELLINRNICAGYVWKVFEVVKEFYVHPDFPKIGEDGRFLNSANHTS